MINLHMQALMLSLPPQRHVWGQARSTTAVTGGAHAEMDSSSTAVACARSGAP